MKGKENLDDWRNTTAELGPLPDPRNKRISKTIRMKIAYSDILRDEAFKRTRETGSKVSEADLVELALDDWFAKMKLIPVGDEGEGDDK